MVHPQDRSRDGLPDPPPPDFSLRLIGLATPRPPVALRRGLFLIGSSPEADLQLRSSRVDAVHAAVLLGRDRCRVVDLAGGPGIAVNGRPAAGAALHEGDLLRVGPFTLRFAGRTQAPDGHRHDGPSTTGGFGNFKVVGAGAAPVPALDVAGEGAVLIGSDARCHLRLHGSGVAPVHALFAELDGRLVLWRLAADAPVLIGGKKITAAQLLDGAKVRIGSVELVYRAAAAAGAAPHPPAPQPAPTALERRPVPDERGNRRDRKTHRANASPPADPAPPGPAAPPPARLPAAAVTAPPPPAVQPTPPSHRAVIEPRAPGSPEPELATRPQPELRTATPASPGTRGPQMPAPEPAATQRAEAAEAEVVKLRPFTRRRPRRVSEPVPAPQDGRAIPPLPGERGTADEVASVPPSGPASGEPEPPGAASSRMTVYAVMLVCMALAAALVWRSLPPRFVVQGSLTFHGDGRAQPLAAQRATLAEIESRLHAPAVLESAARRLGRAGGNPAGPGSGGRPEQRTGAGPGFLAGPSELRRRIVVAWRPSPADAGRASLQLSLTTDQPEADVARLNALLQALHDDAAAAATRPSASHLRIDLLRAEADDLKLEVALRRRQADQLAREAEAAEQAAPTPTRRELLKRREATLRESLSAAIEERVLAQAGAGRQQGGGGPAAAAAAEREARIRGELQKAVAEAAEAAEGADKSDALRRRLEAVRAEAPRLEARAKAKAAELDELLRRGGGTPRPLPPEDARVVERQDLRPWWIAAAVALIAAVFGPLIAFAGRHARPPAPTPDASAPTSMGPRDG
jgi:hypothetical protein